VEIADGQDHRFPRSCLGTPLPDRSGQGRRSDSKRPLKSLKRWWGLLAQAASTGPTDEPQRQLARQTLSLLAFLRNCQEKGTIARDTLARLARNPNPAHSVTALCAELDARFGGDLFRLALSGRDADGQSASPGDWLPAVSPDILIEMTQAGDDALYSPGRWYERMLEWDSGWHARKSGVVYTPDYVAEYLVRQALGPILEQRWAGRGLRIIDPACGGGALIVAACRFLQSRGWTSSGGTAAMICGTDIDGDAVLAARRSLWLEHVSAGVSPTRALGNELAQCIVHDDILCNEQSRSLDGTFDAVVGNPPYRRELASKPLFDRLAASQLGRRYRAARMDLAYYFIHRGLELLAPDGRLSFITGSYWTAGRGARKLVAALRDGFRIEEIFLLDRLPVFSKVAGRHMILTVVREAGDLPTTVKRAPPAGIADPRTVVEGRMALPIYAKQPHQLFRDGILDVEPPCDGLLAKIERGTPLGMLGVVRQGIVENPANITPHMNGRHGNRWRPGEGVFALSPRELDSMALSEREQRLIRPYHDLRDIGRYFVAPAPSLRLIYSTADTWPELDAYPILRDHLQRFRSILDNRRETRLGRRPWWQLHWPREERLWLSPKVIALQMAARPSFAPALAPAYVTFSANVFVPHPNISEHLNYFAAVLNSRILWKWFRHRAKHRGVSLEINGHVLARAPVPRIDFTHAADRARHDELVALVEGMLAARPAPENLDRRIDAIVAEIFQLSDDELALTNGD